MGEVWIFSGTTQLPQVVLLEVSTFAGFILSLTMAQPVIPREFHQFMYANLYIIYVANTKLVLKFHSNPWTKWQHSSGAPVTMKSQ